jgi:dTDP-4-dehydrorhamnose reductase
MRILVTGAKGQVAAALLRAGALQAGIQVTAMGRPDLDLDRPNRSVMARIAPDVVVNAAAYTAVDRAESEEERAFRINAEGAHAIAATAASLGVSIIHLSTDYVFSGGKPDPYDETDTPDPLNAYGRSKLAGERRVAEANPRHVILRTSWIYSDTGSNFVATMLNRAKEAREISVVDDQIGSPTSARLIAQGVLAVATNILRSADNPDLFGTFHMTAAGATSWCGFAQRIFEESAKIGGPSAKVMPIASEDYRTAARRPRNSRLNCARIAAVHDIRLPQWHDGIAEVVASLSGT